MSEVKISELEETTTVQEGCCFPIVAEGVTKKITYGTLAEKLNTIIEPEWTKIKNKPTTYTPSAHTHAQSDITGLETALNNKQGKLTAGTGIKIENDVISATGGTGGGAVDSVNGKTGTVVLSADDVGAIAEPTNEGTSGQVLTTDGNGGRTWTTVNSGSSDCPITELPETLALVDGDNVANLAEGFYRTHAVTINGEANNYFSNSIIYIDRTSTSNKVIIENVAGIPRSNSEALSIYNYYNTSKNNYFINDSCICKSIAWNWVEDKPNITTQEIVTSFWQGTQSEYDALTTKDTATLYLIKEG